MLPPPEDRLTPKQAVRLIGTHISLIYRSIAKGRLRAWRIGESRYVLVRQDVTALVVELTKRPRDSSSSA